MSKRRYKFLTKDYVFGALNRSRAAFLAAQNGSEVEDIINGVLTYDERVKIGRRIQIAEMIQEGVTYRDIKDELKVGIQTIELVARKLSSSPKCYELINKRVEKVEKEYKRKAHEKIGGSTKIFKSKKYTGFKRKDVKR